MQQDFFKFPPKSKGETHVPAHRVKDDKFFLSHISGEWHDYLKFWCVVP